MTAATRLERALSAFTARSAHRDAEVDRARLASLTASLDAMAREIAAERVGIVQRVKRTVDDPNPPAPSWTLGRRPRVSRAEFDILESRLHVLDRQMVELRRIMAIVAALEAPVLAGSAVPGNP